MGFLDFEEWLNRSIIFEIESNNVLISEFSSENEEIVYSTCTKFTLFFRIFKNKKDFLNFRREKLMIIFYFHYDSINSNNYFMFY